MIKLPIKSKPKLQSNKSVPNIQNIKDLHPSEFVESIKNKDYLHSD